MAEGIDQQIVIADVYAAALFDLAREAGAIEAVRGELDELVKVVEADAGFAAYLASPVVDSDERAAALEKVLRGKLDDRVLNTLLVMNRNGRAGLVVALRRAYVVRQEAEAGEIEVRVTSAVKLKKEQREEVEAVAAEISGRTPIVEYVVDKDIIGGLVVQVGDLRFDDSVARHLDRTQRQFHERGSRGLQVGVET